MFNEFSSAENLKTAYRHVKNEILSSPLSADPINRAMLPAIENLGDDFFITLQKQIKNNEYRAQNGHFVYLPKENLGIRPLCINTLTDKIVYQAIFNHNILGSFLDGQLSEQSCFANRLNPEVDGFYFTHYAYGWTNFFQKQKEALEEGYIWKLDFDIRQYYEHIPVKSLIGLLEEKFDVKDKKILEILYNQLEKWVEYPELSKGIPQGAYASALLGNLYLSQVDSFIEQNFHPEEVRYFRYADDMVLMAKDKKDILENIEKIVQFLRKINLSINEKTKITEVESVEELMRYSFFGDYEEEVVEIPEDEFTRVSENIPYTLETMSDGEQVSSLDIRELKYFLNTDKTFDFRNASLLTYCIPYYPSLTMVIVRYLSEARKTFDDFDNYILESQLWNSYQDKKLSRWTRFWILKYFIGNKNIEIKELEPEIEKIIKEPQPSIFKIVAYYYYIINEKEIDAELIKRDIDMSSSDSEKSIFSSFLFHSSKGKNKNTVKALITKMMKEENPDINIIGKNISADQEIEIVTTNNLSSFSKDLLGIKREEKKDDVQSPYSVTLESETPISIFETPEKKMGLERKRMKGGLLDFETPSDFEWSKVELKIKEGLMDVEVFYDKKRIEQKDFIELKFSKNSKDPIPKNNWHLLCLFAFLQKEDISQATPVNLLRMMKDYMKEGAKTSNIHQTKKGLTKDLKKMFDTDKNPFTDNRVYYEPIFTIKPPTSMNTNLWEQGGKLNTNKQQDEFDDSSEYLTF